jgi:hypothetical protein
MRYNFLAASCEHPILNFSDLWLCLKDNVNFQVVFYKMEQYGRENQIPRRGGPGRGQHRYRCYLYHEVGVLDPE